MYGELTRELTNGFGIVDSPDAYLYHRTGVLYRVLYSTVQYRVVLLYSIYSIYITA